MINDDDNPKATRAENEIGGFSALNRKLKQKAVTQPFWKIALIIAIGVIAGLIAPDDFSMAQKIMLGIFVAAAGLWVTEALPPFATAILVMVSCVYLLGQPGGALGFEGVKDYLIFINPVADPVIVLFFGGFIMANAVTKYGLDRIFACTLLQPFSKSPNHILLGVILVTGFFSMFMSNTATALMMMAILMPVLGALDEDHSLRRKSALAVAFAANIGGMGTIIGTPPNAIAVSVLANAGLKVNFLSWMIVGAPLVFVLLTVVWVILVVLFPSPKTEHVITIERPYATHGWETWVVFGTFLITVGLWMTETLHGLSPAIVALIPLTVFSATGLLNATDLKRLEWDVLILVAGGLALGVGLQTTGLSGKIVSLIPVEGLPVKAVFLVIAVVTVILSNFMSNTSAANILIPIAVSLANTSPLLGAMTVAFSASLAMSLPISTPPNALVYGTGMVKNRDMLVAGSLVTGFGILIVVLMISLGIERLFPAN